jgi:hypothetical protein
MESEDIMHDTAYHYGQLFYDAYIPKGQNVQIVEIGSQNVNGGLRDIFTTPYTNFVGLDFVNGPGVDHVLEDPYKIPYSDNSVEILLCSSVLEHCEMFWVLFLEMARVVKPGGLIYINAPSNGVVHRFPVDCWRFYPDSGKALAKWAKQNDHDITMLESFLGNEGPHGFSDFVGVFCKGGDYVSQHKNRILYNTADYTNGFLNNEPV